MPKTTIRDAVKFVQDLWIWANDQHLISKLNPTGKPFIWYDDFKKYVFMTKGIDKHTIYSWRDLMKLYGFLEFDVFDRVYFVFQTSDMYKKETGNKGLGAFLDE